MTRYVPVSVARKCTFCPLGENATSSPDGEIIRAAGPGRSNSPVESESADSSTECVIHSIPPAISNGNADCKGKLELCGSKPMISNLRPFCSRARISGAGGFPSVEAKIVSVGTILISAGLRTLTSCVRTQRVTGCCEFHPTTRTERDAAAAGPLTNQMELKTG